MLSLADTSKVDTMDSMLTGDEFLSVLNLRERLGLGVFSPWGKYVLTLSLKAYKVVISVDGENENASDPISCDVFLKMFRGELDTASIKGRRHDRRLGRTVVFNPRVRVNIDRKSEFIHGLKLRSYWR
jgi:hypothetical protein